ncbi:MAG TPA: helix-turn-helix domain-containing protein [Nitrososphaera sp.]|nr:helix-turn-helix domain-containing protein [Nitrososphaera sp.]
MDAEVLFGGKTRFVILEALAEAKKPMTAYQIAMTKGLDPAATYRCLAEYSEFGVVVPEIKERNQTAYKLSKGSGKAATDFMRSLEQKTSESVDLEKWISPEMQAERMEKIVRLDVNQLNTSLFNQLGGRKGVKEILSKRIPGELSALIKSSQIAFNELFEEKYGTFILKT